MTLASAEKVDERSTSSSDTRVTDGPPRRSLRLSVVAIAMGVIAAVVVLIATGKGAGVTYDSNFYLSAGLNFASGRGLVDFHSQALVWYPPGYAIEFSIAHWIGVTAQSMDKVVSCVEIAAHGFSWW